MIVVWHCILGSLVGVLSGHTLPINCLLFLPQVTQFNASRKTCIFDTKFTLQVEILASGSADKTIRLWARTGSEERAPWSCLKVLNAHNASVQSLIPITFPSLRSLALSSSNLNVFDSVLGSSTPSPSPPPANMTGFASGANDRIIGLWSETV